MRASKNKTVEYLYDLTEERREEVLLKAIKWGMLQRDKRKKRQVEIRAEIIIRQKEKAYSRDTKERKKLEKKLKESDLENVRKDYPSLDFSKTEDLEDILQGKVVGKKTCHAWFDEETGLVVYNAKLEKFKKTQVYRVACWSQAEDYTDATDYDMPMYQLAADLLHGDLAFCS